MSGIIKILMKQHHKILSQILSSEKHFNKTKKFVREIKYFSLAKD